MSMTRAQYRATLPRTAAKAYVGAIIAALVAGLGALSAALADGAVTNIELITIATAMLISLGSVFGGVYATSNTPKG